MRIRDVRFIASADRIDRVPPPQFAEVAFAGRSNVGKSTLINRLVERRKLVRTSGTPGCTRGINLYRVELKEPGDAVIDLVDLPGYGYAKRSKTERRAWGQLIEGYLTTRDNLRATVVIVDIRRGFEEEDRQLLEYLGSLGARAVPVATKLDKIPSSQRRARLESLRREAKLPIFGVSGEKGLGIEELWAALLREASVGAPTDAPPARPE